ncbi:TfoX/Sxy family protein [Xanthomonas albilineans]|uniref:TfoX/Sxy family protein n=1 Tax=Xanthomonas albilineans TaxID=29447 RepID=UPI0005F32B57|nr:TfoX/Sxy family protein [Xanthomonas albilineans]
MRRPTKLRNIGPKSTAWLRQVGVHTPQDLAAAGAIGAFLKVKRAGFKPSLNLLYSLEGALRDCHWQQLPEARRTQLLSELETAATALQAAHGRPMAAPVATTCFARDNDDDDDDDKAHNSTGSNEEPSRRAGTSAID